MIYTQKYACIQWGENNKYARINNVAENGK